MNYSAIKVLFVSGLDTTFAQVAECLFNDKAVAYGLSHRAISAGIMAVDGNELPFPVLKALWLRGVETENVLSRAYTDDLFKSADMVIALNKQLKFSLPKSDKIFTLGELLGLDELKLHQSDEIGYYLDVCTDMDKYITKLLEKIKNKENTL